MDGVSVEVDPVGEVSVEVDPVELPSVEVDPDEVDPVMYGTVLSPMISTVVV